MNRIAARALTAAVSPRVAATHAGIGVLQALVGPKLAAALAFADVGVAALQEPVQPVRVEHLRGTSVGLLRATPASTSPTDRPVSPSPGEPARITFSPDGDGRYDQAALQIRTRKSSVVLRVYARGGASHGAPRWWRLVHQSAPVTVLNGRARLTWSGRIPGGRDRAEGAFVLTACTTGSTTRRRGGGPLWLSRACLGTPVIANVRLLGASSATTSSFAPGTTVPLLLETDKRRVHVSIVQDGARGRRIVYNRWHRARPRISLRLPQKLRADRYHVEVRDRLGAIAYAPIVVRNHRFPLATPPEKTALVVWPYLTWRAYSAMDDNRDGRPDTWYEDFRQRTITAVGDLNTITYENGYRQTHQFSRWLHDRRLNHRVQMITDVELATFDDQELGRYAALIFPGHTEYYTKGMIDRVQGYRDDGGKIVLLGANNFYRKVEMLPGINRITMADVRGNCPKCYTVRDGKRVDECLLGMGYAGCCFRRGAMFRVTREGIQAAPWLWEGTGITAGDRFGWADIEVDRVNQALSPGRSSILATARLRKNGRWIRAEMGLTAMPGGGEIFGTGNEYFLSQSDRTPGGRYVVRVMLNNLWDRYVEEDDA